MRRQWKVGASLPVRSADIAGCTDQAEGGGKRLSGNLGEVSMHTPRMIALGACLAAAGLAGSAGMASAQHRSPALWPASERMSSPAERPPLDNAIRAAGSATAQQTLAALAEAIRPSEAPAASSPRGRTRFVEPARWPSASATGAGSMRPLPLGRQQANESAPEVTRITFGNIAPLHTPHAQAAAHRTVAVHSNLTSGGRIQPQTIWPVQASQISTRSANAPRSSEDRVLAIHRESKRQPPASQMPSAGQSSRGEGNYHFAGQIQANPLRRGESPESKRRRIANPLR